MATDCSCWQLLPDSILLEIFSYLNTFELTKAAHTCNSWCRVSYDEVLWKNFFIKEWKLSNSVRLAPGRTSWRSEFKRLSHHVPAVQHEVLCKHSDEVLHVSFSNNGEMFASCSKDGFIVVWNSDYPASVRHKCDMKVFHWTYTQFSQFNRNDTLLLVSGIYFQPYSTCGEIAVFSLQGEFELQCRVKNKPYDIFGTWYSDSYLISGGHHLLGNHASSSILYLYKASQETDSERKSVLAQLYKFYNKNGTLRSIMIANCQSSEEMSHDVLDEAACDSAESLNSILSDEDTEQAVVLDYRDKYLIFTTGSQSYVPHQIGIKKIKPFKFNLNLNVDMEKQLSEHRERERLKASTREPLINYQDEQSVRHLFDHIDHRIELNGYIIGMALAPDHRYLYVNCRMWPNGYVINDPFVPPPIAQEIDVFVFDLVSMRQLDICYRSHKAYTAIEDCFFIFLDVSNSYVASGAEDKNGYLWDRHYQMCVTRFPHSSVVNSVAFNPVNEEMLVSASDDHTIKVWRSKALVPHLKYGQVL